MRSQSPRKPSLPAGQAKEAALAKLPELTEELNAMKKDVGELKSQKLSDQQKNRSRRGGLKA